MQVKIYQQIEKLLTDEGFNVNPPGADLKGTDELPAVWIVFPDDQMESAVEDEEQEVGHLINEWEIIFNIMVESNRDNYRVECMNIIQTMKRIIYDNRQIPSDTDGCLARKWEYLASEIVNFRNNKHCSGGVTMNTLVTYAQRRDDPFNN